MIASVLWPLEILYGALFDSHHAKLKLSIKYNHPVDMLRPFSNSSRPHWFWHLVYHAYEPLINELDRRQLNRDTTWCPGTDRVLCEGLQRTFSALSTLRAELVWRIQQSCSTNILWQPPWHDVTLQAVYMSICRSMVLFEPWSADSLVHQSIRDE